MASVVVSSFVTVVSSIVISVVIGIVDEPVVEEVVLVLSVLVSGSIGAFIGVVGVVEDELNGVVEEDPSDWHFGKLLTRSELLISRLFSPQPDVWMKRVAVEVVTCTFVLVINVVVTVLKTVLVALIIELQISVNGRKMENMGSSWIGRPEYRSFFKLPTI